MNTFLVIYLIFLVLFVAGFVWAGIDYFQSGLWRK